MASASGSRAGQVRAVLDRQVDAWNRGDLEAFMRGYWRSDDLTFFSGATRTAGYAGTLERYRKKYQRDGQPMGHLDFPQIDVTPLGRTAALVRGEWRLKRGRETLGGLFTLVLRRIGGQWKIVHDHTAAREK
jgi:ketosteroid isomerase-like protein